MNPPLNGHPNSHGWFAVILLVVALTGQACTNRLVTECDDPFPALVVTAVDDSGGPVVLEVVEVFRGEQLVLTVPCATWGCETQNLATGTYRVVASTSGESRERVVAIVSSHACDHVPTEVQFTF